jgi:DNA-binding transcriptional regulator YiaG
MTARKQAAAPTALADRLAVLGIEAAEVAAIIRRPAEEVEQWVSGDAEPDAAARILLRLFMDPERSHAAQLAAERVRHTYTRDLRGEAAEHAGIEAPAYGGGHTGETGGRPE